MKKLVAVLVGLMLMNVAFGQRWEYLLHYQVTSPETAVGALLPDGNTLQIPGVLPLGVYLSALGLEVEEWMQPDVRPGALAKQQLEFIIMQALGSEGWEYVERNYILFDREYYTLLFKRRSD